MAGNTLGGRAYYRYEDDAGNEFKFLTDEDLGDAGGNTKNDTLPDLPRRFKPRGVYAQANSGERKFIVVGDVTGSLYASNASQTVTIDTLQFKTTGRRGEQVSFGFNATEDPPIAGA